MKQILDQYGNPIMKDDLLEEKAGPALTGTRSILSTHPTAGLTPSRLAGLLRSAEEGDASGYLEMAEDLEDKDPHYLSILGTRKRAVTRMEISVEAASDAAEDVANADLVRAWIDRDTLKSELFDILDAVGKGFSVVEILWDLSESQWMPKELKWRDPKWCEFDRIDGQTLRLINGAERVDLSAYKFIVHTHKAKSGLAIRGGVARPCAWMWLFKNFSVKDWVIFAEAYGQPIRLGKYGPGASKEDRDVLLRAVRNIGSDAAAIIPESMMIEFVEAQGKTATAEVFERLCNFCDTQMSKAVLGQTTTTDAIAGGHAVSKEHNEVREDIAESDADQLAARLTQTIAVPLVTLNRGPQKRYPRIVIRDPEDVDIDAVSTAADRAVRFGMRISERKLRDRLGLPEPEDDEDILRLPAGAAAEPPPDPAPSPKSAAASAQRPVMDPVDAIDALGDKMAADWEELLDPLVSGIVKAAEESASYEVFAQKLLEIVPDLDTARLREKLARAAFASRLAGNHDAPIGEPHAGDH